MCVLLLIRAENSRQLQHALQCSSVQYWQQCSIGCRFFFAVWEVSGWQGKWGHLGPPPSQILCNFCFSIIILVIVIVINIFKSFGYIFREYVTWYLIFQQQWKQGWLRIWKRELVTALKTQHTKKCRTRMIMRWSVPTSPDVFVKKIQIGINCWRFFRPTIWMFWPQILFCAEQYVLRARVFPASTPTGPSIYVMAEYVNM